MKTLYAAQYLYLFIEPLKHFLVPHSKNIFTQRVNREIFAQAYVVL